MYTPPRILLLRFFIRTVLHLFTCSIGMYTRFPLLLLYKISLIPLPPYLLRPFTPLFVYAYEFVDCVSSANVNRKYTRLADKESRDSTINPLKFPPVLCDLEKLRRRKGCRSRFKNDSRYFHVVLPSMTMKFKVSKKCVCAGGLVKKYRCFLRRSVPIPILQSDRLLGRSF